MLQDGLFQRKSEITAGEMTQASQYSAQTITDHILERLLVVCNIEQFYQVQAKIHRKKDLVCLIVDEPISSEEIWETACFAYLSQLPLLERHTFLLPILATDFRQKGINLDDAQMMAQLLFLSQFEINLVQ